MKKNLSKIRLALIGLFISLMSFSVMGQRVTLDFTTNGWNLPTSNSSADGSYTSGDYTIAIHPATSFRFADNYLLLGKSGSTLTLPAFDFPVEKIVVVGRNGASASTKQNIFVGSTAVSTETKGSVNTNEYEIDPAYQAAGNVFTLKVTSSHNTQITYIKVYEADATGGDVVAPTLSASTGAYYDPFMVTISTETAGASIYYTTDGTTPTVNSTLYTAPIAVNATTTLKAVTVNNGQLSSVVTATYSFPVEVATIADFKATAQSNVVYKITGDVTYVFRNGRYMFIKDATGGLLIYDNSNAVITTQYQEGDVISGGVYGKVSVYNGLTEMVPVRNTAASVANTGIVAPMEISVANLLENYDTYESMLVKVVGVTFTNNNNFTQDGNEMTIYNRFNTVTSTRENGDVADVIGFLCTYNTNNKVQRQLFPRDNNDIILGFNDDFENESTWVLGNDLSNNKWYIGTAQGFDNNKLYISSSNGVTNKYANEATIVTASRQINVRNGALLSFDYRVAGEENYDYLKVEISNGTATEVLAKLSGVNEWAHASLEISPDFAGDATLTFTWVNDANGVQNQYPAAIDNISLVEAPCALVTNLQASVNATSATVTWTPQQGQTSWTFEYKMVEAPTWYSMTVNTPSVNLSQLQGDNVYNMRVRANCGDEQSGWIEGTFEVECQNLVSQYGSPIIGTGTTTSYNGPFNNYFKNSWNQTIYPAADIEMSGEIRSLAWEVGAMSSFTMDNMKIYLGTTTKSEAANTSDWLPMSELTLVYDANNVVAGTAMGWENYNLTTPFYYNGEDNLVVVVAKTSSGYSSSLKYRYTSVNNASLYRQSDVYADHAQHPGNNTGTRGYYRPNIKVNIESRVCEDLPFCSEPTQLTATNIGTTGATLTWTPGANEEEWLVEYKAADATEWITEEASMAMVSLTNLTPNTTYDVRVKSICGEYNHSLYATAQFTTEPSCLAPTNVVNNNNRNNTTIYWTPGANETSWIVEYKPQSATEWSSVSISNEPLAILSNLLGNTAYDVRVKAVCGNNEESVWVNHQFVTNCAVYALPFTVTFEEDEYNKEAACWTFLNNNTPSSNQYPQAFVNTVVSYVHSGSKSLYFKSSATTPIFALLPEFDANNVRVNFFYRNESENTSNGTLSIGYMTNPNDASTFTEVESYNIMTTFQEKHADFVDLNGARIAFKYMGNNNNNYYLAIDDISVQAINRCPLPAQVEVSSVTTTNAVISWHGATASQWEVSYGVAGFAPEAGTTVMVNEPTFALTGLTANTSYDVYVRALCGAEGNSDWTQVTTFTTAICEEEDLCSFEIEMIDSYGDGWNGASIKVLADGKEIGNYTCAGSSTTKTVRVCSTQVISFVWSSGSYDSECSLNIYNANHQLEYNNEHLTSSGLLHTTSCVGSVTPPSEDECVLSIPYQEGFEDVLYSTYNTNGSLPECWKSYSTNATRPHVIGGTTGSYRYIHSGTQALTFYGSGTNHAIFPAFNVPLNTLQVIFWVATESDTRGELSIGYVTDPDDKNTFTPVQVIPASASTKGVNGVPGSGGEVIVVELGNVPANATNLAFRYVMSSQWSCCVDDIIIETIASCRKAAITDIATTTNSATITTNTIDNATSYEIIYGNVGFDPNQEGTRVMINEGNTVTISGLQSSSYYAAHVRTICSETDMSDWGREYVFNTQCAPHTIPFTETFENADHEGLPLCWESKFMGTSNLYGASVQNNATYALSGTKSLQLYNCKTESTYETYGDAYLMLPELGVDINMTALKFSARRYTSSNENSGYFEVGVVTDPEHPETSFIPVQQELCPASAAYEPFVISFENYTGPEGRIALRATKNIAEAASTGSYIYTNVYIDNLGIEQAVFNKDMMVTGIENIDDACDFAGKKVSITVNNHNSEGTVTAYQANYQVIADGVASAVVSEQVTYTTPLEMGEDTIFVFSEDLSNLMNGDEMIVKAWVSYPGDGNTANDTIISNVINRIAPVVAPLTENFQDVVIGENGWRQIVENNNPNRWQNVNGTPTCEANDEFDSKAAFMTSCLHIPAGSYIISYDYNALGAMSENLNVYIGTSDNPETWLMIGQHTDFSYVAGGHHAEYNFNVDEEDVYYFMAEAASLKGNLGVCVDNLKIEKMINVQVLADENGTVNPTGSFRIGEGENLDLTILPNAGYHVASIVVNGTEVMGEDPMQGNVYNYILEDVRMSTVVEVAFVENILQVQKIVNPTMNHGQFVPATTDVVNYGAAHTITIAPDAHYHLNGLFVSNNPTEMGTEQTNNAVREGANYTYSFDHVYVDKYVTASFRIDTVGIHYTVNGLGSVEGRTITGEDVQPVLFDHYVDYGTTLTVPFIAATGYHVASIVINGVNYGPLAVWQFANITEEKYVTVNFEKDVYTIATIGYGHGTVSESETFEYDPAHTYEFTATPETGYVISRILRNNENVYIANPEAAYTETLTNIISNYTYEVTFNPSTYTVTATTGNNGTVSPVGVTAYNYNDNAVYNVAANAGYYIQSITIDGVTTTYTQDDALTTWAHTFNFAGTEAVNHTISATFAQFAYTITVDNVENGTITPGTGIFMHGTTPTFTINPAVGYGIVDVLVDGESVGAVSTYTFAALTGNHTITATFAQYQYTIQANASFGGSITPSGVVNAMHGENKFFSIAPATGYHIADVFVDGVSVGAQTQYSFTNIEANHSIVAQFEVNTFNVLVNQPANGVITPGTQSVVYGATPTFVVTPNTGFEVTAITVNGTNVMANAVNTNGVYTYTTSPIVANTTISATMTKKTFTITKNAGANGTINGSTTITYGADAAYTIVPAAGYVVDQVTVDGMNMGAITSYIFTNVVANHTIAATFRLMDCEVPTNMHTTDITTNAATFTWYHPTANSFEIQYKALDATSFTTATVTGMSYDVLNLTPSTTYVWMVRTNCSTNNYSAWSNGNLFRTADEISIPDGIEEHIANLIKVYASHNNVYIVNNEGVQIENVQIYDIYGKVVYSGNVTTQNEVISLNVATGAYMVQLTTNKGTANYKVFINR